MEKTYNIDGQKVTGLAASITSGGGKTEYVNYNFSEITVRQ